MHVIDSDGKECNTWEEIEEACLKENQACFNQARDTPFLQEPLFSLVGNYREGKGVTSILEGTFEIPGILPELKEILQALHTCCLDMDQPFPRFTMDSYRSIWSKAKEKMSSCAHYELHFGHYMAVCADPQLIELHVQLIDITLMMGYSPTRWRTGVNVMIPKKEGNYNVEQLQTILLYNAEFNGLLKWLG